MEPDHFLSEARALSKFKKKWVARETDVKKKTVH